MLCRLCLSAGKLVKAHIIPEAFSRAVRTGDEVSLIVTSAPNTFPKRSRIGVYDQNILCDKCEPKFDRMDHYGTEIFLNQREQLFQAISDGNEIAAFQAKNIDQKLLLQFLVATLWRASVSTQPFYKRVNLGPHEETARQMILNSNQAVPTIFSAVLSCWTADEEHQAMANGLMDPFRERWDGVMAYRVYFGHIVAYIKVDRRPFLDPFDKIALLAQNQVILIARDFGESKDFAAMKHTALLSYKNSQDKTLK